MVERRGRRRRHVPKTLRTTPSCSGGNPHSVKKWRPLQASILAQAPWHSKSTVTLIGAKNSKAGEKGRREESRERRRWKRCERADTARGGGTIAATRDRKSGACALRRMLDPLLRGLPGRSGTSPRTTRWRSGWEPPTPAAASWPGERGATWRWG